jgi:hypothetical protein
VRTLAAFFGLALLAAAAAPASAADVALIGPAGQHRTITESELAHLAQVSEHIAFQTEHGPREADYAGAKLWDVLHAAKLTKSSHPRDLLREAIVVTGRDGYMVVVAMGEIQPDFEAKRIVLAQTKNGKPLPGGEVRLVVPGDRHGGRSVRDVVRVEVRRVGGQ